MADRTEWKGRHSLKFLAVHLHSYLEAQVGVQSQHLPPPVMVTVEEVMATMPVERETKA